MFPGPSLTPKTTTNGQTLSRLAELAEAVSKQQHSASVARLMTMNGNGLNASQQVGAVSLALRKRPAEMGGLPSAPVADPTAKRPRTASATGAPDQSGDDAEGEDLKDVRFREYQAEIWSEKFEDLCEFRRQYGHCHVPHTYTENAPLAQWVKRQRYQYKLKSEGKRSTLSDERVRLLDQIGFIWNSHDVVWEERWHELLAFKRGHGHCIVPSNYDKNPQLAVWVKRQRRQFKFYQEKKATSMTPERIAKLDKLGFAWDCRKNNTGTGGAKGGGDSDDDNSDAKDAAPAAAAVRPTATTTTTAPLVNGLTMESVLRLGGFPLPKPSSYGGGGGANNLRTVVAVKQHESRGAQMSTVVAPAPSEGGNSSQQSPAAAASKPAPSEAAATTLSSLPCEFFSFSKFTKFPKINLYK